MSNNNLPLTNEQFTAACEKFLRFNYNFPTSYITYPTIWDGEKTASMPSFFAALPSDMVEHFYGKWRYYYDTYGSQGALPAFLGAITDNYRTLIYNWINENYNPYK